MGEYGHSTSVLPPEAPAHVRAVGNSGGWKLTRFSKVFQNRGLKDADVLEQTSKLTEEWTARAEREWGLADKLLRTHAGNVGMVE